MRDFLERMLGVASLRDTLEQMKEADYQACLALENATGRNWLDFSNEGVPDGIANLAAEKRAQMLRADRAEQDAASARNDVQALDARAREDARRIARAAELLDDEREVSEDLRAENVALKAELESLRTLIGNARNQLDGRAHHSVTSIEIAECVGA